MEYEVGWDGSLDVAAVLSSSSRLTDLGAWYAAAHPSLLRFAYIVCRDQAVAEDLVQETFVRLYRAGRRGEEEGLDAYARRTITNLNRSRFRRMARERRALAALPQEGTMPPPDPDSLWDALASLSPQQRACVALRYYEGMTEPETATILGISVGSVKRQVHRAMGKLRSIVREEP